MSPKQMSTGPVLPENAANASRTVGASQRIASIKAYLVYSILGHLGWETLHLPIYTIFWHAPAKETAFAVLHCTVGDILIAATTLTFSYLIVGNRSWPVNRSVYIRVAGTAMLLGVLYTAFSEWLNTTVRHTWSYMPAMPVIPVVNVGIAPLLQWIVVPLFAFVLAARQTTADHRTGHRATLQ